MEIRHSGRFGGKISGEPDLHSVIIDGLTDKTFYLLDTFTWQYA